MGKIVTSDDIMQAFGRLGISAGDIVLIHSSLKSLGALEDGAETVVQGVESLLGKEGTLVMPTLSIIDFTNSYKTWYMDKPSDVGYLTEYFRKLPYVYRSNQATHSVAARGRKAYELTFEHTAYGPHLCPFGEYAFAESSPWVKMYKADAHIVFLGVNLTYNTMKHVVEAKFVEYLLANIQDRAKAEEQKAKLMTFETFEKKGFWPFYSGPDMEDALQEAGLLTETVCGNATLKRISAKQSTDFAVEQLLSAPSKWYGGEVLEWIYDCMEAQK